MDNAPSVFSATQPVRRQTTRITWTLHQPFQPNVSTSTDNIAPTLQVTCRHLLRSICPMYRWPLAFRFFLEFHFRARWGTAPYVALHYVCLCVSRVSSSTYSSLPFRLEPPRS